MLHEFSSDTENVAYSGRNERYFDPKEEGTMFLVSVGKSSERRSKQKKNPEIANFFLVNSLL